MPAIMSAITLKDVPMDAIYLYYKKRTLFFLLSFMGLLLYRSFEFLYEGMFYNIVKHPISPNISIIVSKVPFHFPESLARINYFVLGFVVLLIFIILICLKWFLHPGYKYAITNQGITNSKGHYIPWSAIKQIKKIRHKGRIVFFVKFKNPQSYYGKYTSLFVNGLFLSNDIFYADRSQFQQLYFLLPRHLII